MTQPRLTRQLGTRDAVLLGLGSILGTGVFVSLAIATGVAGVWVLPAILLAALPAACNGLSSAALAAAHPVSGGTYEYGYRWLSPAAGFSAGWLFLLAKSASAATAALGCSGYILTLLGASAQWRIPLALTITAMLTLLVFSGIRRSAQANAAALAVTVLALLAFVLAGLARLPQGWDAHIAALWDGRAPLDWAALLEASALLFVAYTGYGRIATLGEEVLEPRRTIPRAIVITLLFSAGLYALVALAAVASAGPETFGSFAQSSAAPLAAAARLLDFPGLPQLLALGAVTAMLGVLLNLLLGLSRVVLAMGRRGDLPALFARLNTGADAPPAATSLCAALILALVCLGDVKTTWSFSAFTVLVYYALTNLAALRLAAHERLAHPGVALCGLLSSLALALCIEQRIWLAGGSLLLLGLLWHWLRTAARGRAADMACPD